MPENTIVIKPSDRPEILVVRDSFDDIIRNKCARGFSASHQRVSRLNYIIITDGVNRAVLADIVKVTHANPINENGRGRVDIKFENVQINDEIFDDVHNIIQWNSRTNIRYINYTP